MRRILHFLAFLTLALVAAAQPFRPWLNPGISDPRNLNGLAAWYDASATSSMLSVSGATITDGGAVALWGDKSGNSGVNCLVMAGGTGNGASVPDSVALSVTSDIDIRCYAAPAVAVPAAAVVLVSKFTVAGNQRSYLLRIDTAGKLTMNLSQDGSASVAATSSAAVGTANFERVGYRGTWRQSDGRVQFFKRSDSDISADTGWTQVGTDQSIAVASIFNGSGAVEIGIRDGTTDPFAGNIYRAIIKSGIDGTTVLDIDFSTSPKKLANGDKFTCATGQEVTLNSSGATGARIAGERDLYQGTAANRPTYLAYSGTKYGYLNGTAGNYFSTPDSALVSITGDIDIIAQVKMADWTPSASQRIVSKFIAGTNQRSYLFSVVPSGSLSLALSFNGTGSTGYDSTLATGFTDGTTNWIRAIRSGSTVKFYTSSNGVSWTQLGADVASVSTALYDGTAAVEVGATEGGTSGVVNGSIYYVGVWNGISDSGGTLAAVFNPALYTSGTTFTASTGETWTINGGAHIVTRTGLYFPGATQNLRSPAFSLSQPETVYLIGEQVSWTINDGLYDGNSLDSMQIAQTSTTPRISMYAGAETGIVNPVLKTAYAITNVFNGASSSGRLNRSSAASGNAGTSAASGFVLGAKGNISAPANIFVSEVAIYSAAHDTATQNSVALYEIIKWRIVE